MEEKGSVLVVDDEAYVRDSLALVLSRNGYRARTAEGCDDALAAVETSRTAGPRLDAVITDLKMPGRDGRQLVREVAARAVPVIVLTAYGTVPSAVECLKLGARDYLLKPASPEDVLSALERVIGSRSAASVDEQEELAPQREDRKPARGEPIGVSGSWLRARELAELAAPASTSVLLVGESGTGKEELARLIHGKSPRAGAAFVGVNCAAVPSELFESEFFGHRRGAFTGAIADREGRFRLAHRGTLFLDEISSLASSSQAKLLRVLEEGVFERVGESRPSEVHVRLICAGGTDLPALVESGRFRHDLYYRINVMTIHVPPLRERREDIPVLAAAFLAEFRTRLGKRVESIHEDALALLTAYPWPGNVRELKNVIERGVLLETTRSLLPDSLPFGRCGSVDLGLRGALASEERRLLSEALRRANGVRREAAQLLGIDERNLAYYLKKHALMKR